MPAASPSHHVSQIEGAAAHGAKWPTPSEATPTVAATVGLTMAASPTNLTTSWPRAKACRPEAKRVTRYAPVSASSELPVAMPSDVAIEPAVVTFAAKAPTKTAGHIR